MNSYLVQSGLLVAVLLGLAGCSSGSSGTLGAGNCKNRAIGESCKFCDTCQSTADGVGHCEGDSLDAPGVCVLLQFGKEGDGPCVGTFDHGTVNLEAADGGVASGAVICGMGQGCGETDLYCSADTGKCAKRNALSATCQSCSYMAKCQAPGPCASGSYCDGNGTCAPVKNAGDACQDHPECGDNYCSSDSMVCTAYLPPGANCTSGEPCSTSACINGKCAGTTGDPCSDLAWSTSY